MIYLNRDKYLDKPKPWGMLSDVRDNLFRRADSIGLDPVFCVHMYPLWETAGRIVYDYGFGGVDLDIKTTSDFELNEKGLYNPTTQPGGTDEPLASVSSTGETMTVGKTLTLVTRFKATTDVNGRLAGKHRAGKYGWLFSTGVGRKVAVGVSYNGSAWSYTESAVNVYNLNEDLTFIGRFDGANINIFINDLKKYTKSYSNTVFDDNSQPLAIGSDGYSNNSFVGTIYTSQIFSTKLSDTQLDILRERPYFFFEPQPVTGYFLASSGPPAPPAKKFIKVKMENRAGANSTNLSNLQFAWFENSNIGSLPEPKLKGNTGTIDASGFFKKEITETTSLNIGDKGFLLVSDTDGTTTKNPPHKSFFGVVEITGEEIV